jgi:hypothetical protein
MSINTEIIPTTYYYFKRSINFLFRFSTFLSLFFYFDINSIREAYGQDETLIGPIEGKYQEDSKIDKRLVNDSQIKGIISSCRTDQTLKKDEKGVELDIKSAEEKIDKCIKDKMSKFSPQDSKKIAETLPTTDLDLQDSIRYQSNPAYKNLENYLSKRLEEALYGKENQKNKGTLTLTKHEIFYDIFKTQLGKNILSTVTSFCINADENLLQSSEPTERSQQRIKNISKLTEMLPMQDSNSANGGQANQQADASDSNAAYRHYANCISKLPHICDGTSVEYPNGMTWKFEDEIKSSQTPAGAQGNSGEDKLNTSKNYTINQACTTTRELKRLRKALIDNQDTLDKIKKHKSENPQTVKLNIKNLEKIYGTGSDPNEATLDDLTSLTSNEFANKSGMNKKLNEQGNFFVTNCVNGNHPKCKEMINNNKDYADFLKMKDEYNSRTQVLKGKILSMTEQETRDFLLKEGRSQAEVNSILDQAKKNPDSEFLKKQIAESYERERESIIKQMSEKLENSNIELGQLAAASTYNGSTISSGNIDPQKVKDLKEKIAQRIENNKTEIRDTILFNNIVTGYLSVQDDKGVKSKNVTAAHREIKDSFLKPENLSKLNLPNNSSGNTGQQAQTVQLDPALFEKLQSVTQQNLPKKGSDRNAQSTNVDVTTLNRNFLGNYMNLDTNELNRLKNTEEANRKPSDQTTNSIK